MKTTTLTILAASLGLIASASAQGERPKGGGRPLPPEIIEKFDKDGDGKLNEEERTAARAARQEMMEARRKEMVEKYDANKDGTLDDAEKATMREEIKKANLAKFDKDGDGKLNDEEKAEMRKEFGDRPGGPRGPRGEGGPRGPRGEGDRKGKGGEAPEEKKVDSPEASEAAAE